MNQVPRFINFRFLKKGGYLGFSKRKFQVCWLYYSDIWEVENQR